MTDEEGLLNDLAGTTKIPKGWEPYAEEAGTIGSAIVRLPRPNATERDLLIQAGFPPEEWQIDGPINVRKWMRHDQEWLYYYRFSVKQGETPEAIEEHIQDLVKHIRRRRYPLSGNVRVGHDGWAFGASDWQIGKKEGAIGTPQTVDRVLEVIEKARRDIKDLRRVGFAMPEGLFLGTGDLLEGTCGFYPNQAFLVDRNRRDQNKITRELITHAIDELAPLFEVFHIKTVGGNHGENRNDGRKATDDGDNDDVGVFEAVKEAFDRGHSAGGGPGNLTWQIPGDELSIAFEVAGVKMGAAHGHTFGNGATAQQKAVNWWRGQDFGYQAVRGAQILWTSHFHHPSLVTYGNRSHVQSGAMDPGSKWFTDRSGEASPPSTTTFRIDPDDPLGFSHMRLLSPST